MALGVILVKVQETVFLATSCVVLVTNGVQL